MVRVPRLLTGLATATVVVAGGYAVAISDWEGFVACLACGFAVAVAWVVVRHDRTSPVGPALAWSTASIALVAAHVGPLAALPWSSGIWPLNLAGLLALMLVFPAGSTRGPVPRAAVALFAVATVASVAAQWGARQAAGDVVGGPEGPWVPPVGLTSFVAIAASILLAAASLGTRYRRGDRRTRGQIRWLLLTGILVLVLLVGGWVAELLGASLGAAYTPFLLAIVVLVPAAVGVAIVRYDLLDVDRVISQTTAWLLTLLFSAAVFGVVVYGVSHAVSLGTGLTTGVAAFVTALVLLPVQRQLARWVGSVVDRDRFLALAAVERFASDVRAGRRPPEDVEAVLRVAMDDPGLVVHVARPTGGWAAVAGAPVAEPSGLAIEAGGDTIARVTLGTDSVRARRRLTDLARLAWVPIEMSRLRLGLKEMLAETQASRRRLVEASAAERRRLERNLHDGAQQRIVATGMRLRLLQERCRPTRQPRWTLPWPNWPAPSKSSDASPRASGRASWTKDSPPRWWRSGRPLRCRSPCTWTIFRTWATPGR
ncbi:MAG: histidine kinase [Micropruina sp.]|uniref:hypothetical protein n=1 Tax=Micropruina sp. TaxID=2737536 RepID=UPI0039E488C8